MTLFDRYVVVDWSARNAPAAGVNSIWVAVLGGDEPVVCSNPMTRAAAERDLVAAIARPELRTLLAIDVSLGYPAGTAARFGLAGRPWEAIWAEITSLVVDDERNHNNRFEVAATLNARAGETPGPFWGCPPAFVCDHLAATKPDVAPLPEFRVTEAVLRTAGWQPKSIWQLVGAGAVGGQTLTALPVLQRLRTGFDVSVWPFTAGAIVPETVPGSIVVAEVWPTRFPIDPDDDRVRDEAQVETVAMALRAADRSGELGEWFAPSVDTGWRAAIEREEGWILGPPTATPVR